MNPFDSATEGSSRISLRVVLFWAFARERKQLFQLQMVAIQAVTRQRDRKPCLALSPAHTTRQLVGFRFGATSREFQHCHWRWDAACQHRRCKYGHRRRCAFE